MKNYKIPNKFPHNHAPNLLLLSNGDLLCTWFGGSCEGKADISIHYSRLKKGEASWSKPVVLSGDEKRSEQNPILYEVKPGHLWLLYTAQIGVHQETAVVRIRKSDDYGRNWSMAEDLFEAEGLFVRNPPIKLENDDILLPAYYCQKSETGFLGDDYSVVKLSSDGGSSWEEVSIPESRGLVHMSAVELNNKVIVGFFRNRRADYIYRTLSKDQGRTWSVPEALELPNNNSSIQCLKLNSERLALVYDDVNKHISPPKVDMPPWFDKKDMENVGVKEVEKPSAVWGVKRNPLVISLSEDGGKTWPYKKELITDEGLEGEPEFSYPSLIQDDTGLIHIAYTYLREYIRYDTIKESEILD